MSPSTNFEKPFAPLHWDPRGYVIEAGITRKGELALRWDKSVPDKPHALYFSDEETKALYKLLVERFSDVVKD